MLSKRKKKAAKQLIDEYVYGFGGSILNLLLVNGFFKLPIQSKCAFKRELTSKIHHRFFYMNRFVYEKYDDIPNFICFG